MKEDDLHIIQIDDDYRELYVNSNSPLNSNNNSDVEEDVEIKTLTHYRKFTFEDVERSLAKYYDTNNKYSNELDILITYMKGQKHLFSESNNVTQFKLYALLFTAITLTTFISIISPFIQDRNWNVIIVSGCNAVATLLLTIMKYLKLESSCTTYTLLANMYDKFENSLEFANNKLLFMDNEMDQNKLVLDKIKEVEFKIGEAKDMCQILVPDEVKHIFPIIYHTNVFRFIKKMEVYRKNLIVRLKDIKNEIRYILYKWNTMDTSDTQKSREKHRLLYLMDLKEKTKAELIEYKNTYNQIDELFMREIKHASEYTQSCMRRWKKPEYHFDKLNPAIRDYIHLISPE